MSFRFPGTLVESVKPNSFGGRGLLSRSGGLSLPFLIRQKPGSSPARWLWAGCRLLRASRAGSLLWFPFRLAELVFPH